MIKDVPLQIKNGTPIPLSEESKELLKGFKENQIVLGDFRGTTKERSIIQLNTYWACCKYVADNVRDYPFGHDEYKHYIRWSQKKLVDKQLRIALHFVDDSLTVKIGKEEFEFHYKSIAIKNLKHLEACRFFDRAFELLALRIGITVDELVEAAKSKMLRRNP